jgi:hypothetical protein
MDYFGVWEYCAQRSVAKVGGSMGVDEKNSIGFYGGLKGIIFILSAELNNKNES